MGSVTHREGYRYRSTLGHQGTQGGTQGCTGKGTGGMRRLVAQGAESVYGRGNHLFEECRWE